MLKRIPSANAASDAGTYIGEIGQLFYDPDSTEIRCSDGITPGGRVMAGAVLQSNTLLSVDDLLNINSTPLELLPAPGPGFMYIIQSVVYTLYFNTTPYSGDGCGIWYGTSVSADTTGNGVFEGAGSQVQQTLSWSVLNYQAIPLSICENSNINLWSPNSTLSGGDSTGMITLYYSILAL